MTEKKTLAPDWQAVLFAPENNLVGRFERLCRKRFWDENIAMEAFNWALDGVRKNDWEVLHSFAGRSSPATFLTTVFNNKLRDFDKHKFGHRRVKKWIASMGTVWEKVWKYLCKERQPEPQICINLSQDSEYSEADIQLMIDTIKAKEADCARQETLTSIGGTSQLTEDAFADGSEKVYQGEDCLGMQNGQQSIDDKILHRQWENVLGAIAALTGLTDLAHLDKQQLAQLSKLSTQLALTSDERFLLKQVYQEGLKISAVARFMQTPDHQIRAMHKALLLRLKTALEACGLDAQMLFSESNVDAKVV